MQKRRFGRTGHESSVAIFGGAALWDATQAEADQAMEQIIAAGVNHIDVAPSYGRAEELLSSWMPRERGRFFLGCKTLERDSQGAAAELRRSLERLRVDAFDLYQLHAIREMSQLDEVMRPGGALDAVLDARDEGLTRFIGLTGHGPNTPVVFLEALRRFDFDSLLFPINFIEFADPTYRRNTVALLQECRRRDVGTMIIKAVGKKPWREQPRTHTTWYEPFVDDWAIQQAVNFALSQDVTALCCPGDLQLLPKFLRACESFTPMSPEEQEELIATAGQFVSVFADGGP